VPSLQIKCVRVRAYLPSKTDSNLIFSLLYTLLLIVHLAGFKKV